jgi:DNA-binding NtrC family response regulator
VEQAAREFGREKPEIPKQVPMLLAQYDFPGNIRELRSMIYDEVSRNRTTLPAEEIRKAISDRQTVDVSSGDEDREALFRSFLAVQRLPTYAEVEDILTEAALHRAEGNQTLAARMLGISQPGLSKRLRSRRKEPLE